MKGLRRLMLDIASVCCVLKCSSDGWTRPPVRCPDWRAVASVLWSNFPDFIPLVRQLTIECRQCSVSASCHCSGGGHAHVQGRTVSWDSSGGDNISQSALRSGEFSGFRGNARVREFHAADHSVNTSVVSSRGFSGAAGFCMLQLRVQERGAAPTLPVTPQSQ